MPVRNVVFQNDLVCWLSPQTMKPLSKDWLTGFVFHPRKNFSTFRARKGITWKYQKGITARKLKPFFALQHQPAPVKICLLLNTKRKSALVSHSPSHTFFYPYHGGKNNTCGLCFFSSHMCPHSLSRGHLKSWVWQGAPSAAAAQWLTSQIRADYKIFRSANFCVQCWYLQWATDN